MNPSKLTPLAIGIAMAMPVLAQPDSGEQESIEEIVVTGSFRESLANSLNAKRNAVNSRESIMAEDIGKMPDLNLAESLQRLPGVAISREGGEGRQITVRGLGPAFTRTTLNGMEVPASSDGLDSSGALNDQRAIDFNVFASELFNRIDVHKSQTAAVEEGGLAATVDLYTAKPFDMPGFRAGFSGQIGYNDLTEENDPRVSAMISNTFADDSFGVLFSIAQTERTVRQEGFGTVRWQESGGWADTTSTVVNGTLAPGTDLGDLWTPRLPRTDYFANEQDRLGATAAFQWRPADTVELGLDYVHSQFDNSRESYNYFAQFRNLYGSITPTSITLDPGGRYIMAGEFEGVSPRSESRGTESSTEFNQVVVSGSFELSDSVTLKTMLGNAESEFRVEQFRFNMTAANPSTFSYDFTANSDIAEMSYGFDILDPANFVFSGPTIRANDVNRDHTTFRLDVEVDNGDFTYNVGLIFNDREVDSQESNVTDRTTPASLDGLTQTVPVSNFGTGLGAPAGFPTNFLVNEFDATIAAYQLGPWVLDEFDGNTWSVQEETLGIYGEVNIDTELMGLPLSVNAGLRVVDTDATMTGAVAVVDGFDSVVITNSYTEVLPSVNLNWELTEDLQGRINLGRNLSRPGLSSLSPTFSYVGLIGNVNGGNPDLDPMIANSIDVGLAWYFADESLLAATIFHKDIDSFIASFVEDRPLDPVVAGIIMSDPDYDPNSWAPIGGNWAHSTPLNNDGASLTGLELAYQQPLGFVSESLENFGLLANYTYVDSESEYGQGDSLVTEDLIGLSQTSWNFSFYYESDNFGGRVSMNNRDDYNTRVPGNNGNDYEATSGSTHIDLSAFYHINEQWSARLEVINLTDEEERLYVGNIAGSDLVREVNHTGTQLFIGLSGKF